MKKLCCAAIAADIPIDVICGILSYLPVKSVLRFKCVSKSWYSLISDSHFKKLHRFQSQKATYDQVFVLQNLDNNYSFCETSFFDDIISGNCTQMELPFRHNLLLSNATILSSCDGLLLVRNSDGQLTLMNPSTKESRKLPEGVVYGSKRPCYDLGYDSSTNDYKVLLRQSVHIPEIDAFRIETTILSLKTNCWRKVKNVTRQDRNGVNFNESLNWVHAKSWLANEIKIVSFSLASETTTEIEHPADCDTGTHADLGVLQGCLCLTATSIFTCSVNIWLMKEFGVPNSWTKLISTPKLPRNYVSRTIPLPLNYTNKTVFLIDKYNGDLLILNDLEAEQHYRFVNIANFRTYKLLTEFAFSRSLVSPNSVFF
ncbi:F-box protein CPR1-like [Mercurialis annua]|uniref:F-box protein CPR1-like n=1 Tax=Mercurialis annua TaxID=3986 RepID=UPI002160861D|nr:F-box protein CPR1-like [Mercurialis annua]